MIVEEYKKLITNGIRSISHPFKNFLIVTTQLMAIIIKLFHVKPFKTISYLINLKTIL